MFTLAQVNATSPEGIDAFLLSVDEEGNTGLHNMLTSAWLRENCSVVKAAIAKASKSVIEQVVAMPDNDGDTALNYAGWDLDAETYQALLDKISDEVLERVVFIAGLAWRSALSFALNHEDPSKASALALMRRLTDETLGRLLLLQNGGGDSLLHFVMPPTISLMMIKRVSASVVDRLIMFQGDADKSTLSITAERTDGVYQALVAKASDEALGVAVTKPEYGSGRSVFHKLAKYQSTICFEELYARVSKDVFNACLLNQDIRSIDTTVLYRAVENPDPLMLQRVCELTPPFLLKRMFGYEVSHPEPKSILAFACKSEGNVAAKIKLLFIYGAVTDTLYEEAKASLPEGLRAAVNVAEVSGRAEAAFKTTPAGRRRREALIYWAFVQSEAARSSIPLPKATCCIIA